MRSSSNTGPSSTPPTDDGTAGTSGPSPTLAHLWYLVSLVTKRVWRPFALEMRWTLLLHVVGGVLAGYTTVGRFLSLHRSTVHMPYFLCGTLMRKHQCFFPEAVSFTARGARDGRAAALILVAAWTATYAYDLRVEVWFQSDPHDAVYGGRWAYGALYQMGLYAWTFFTMAVAFALVPEPTTMGVRYPGEDDAPSRRDCSGTSPKEDRLGSGARRDARGGTGKNATRTTPACGRTFASRSGGRARSTRFVCTSAR